MDGPGVLLGDSLLGGGGLDLMPNGSRNDFRSDRGVDIIFGHGFVDIVFCVCEASDKGVLDGSLDSVMVESLSMDSNELR